MKQGLCRNSFTHEFCCACLRGLHGWVQRYIITESTNNSTSDQIIKPRKDAHLSS